MQEKIIILDFGSQTTQLIGRRLRELNVYCEIVPYNKFPQGDASVKGVILSGSPFSVYDKSAFKVDLSGIRGMPRQTALAEQSGYICLHLEKSLRRSWDMIPF